MGSSTTGCGKSTANKERAKAIKSAKEAEIDRYNEEMKATGRDKLEYEIAKLKNTISNCKLDLNNPSLKNNFSILNKISAAEETLKNKLAQLNTYDK